MRSRAGLTRGRGRRAGRAQAGARLPAGDDAFGALHRHPGLRQAVADYLVRERREVERMSEMLEGATPFRQADPREEQD